MGINVSIDLGATEVKDRREFKPLNIEEGEKLRVRAEAKGFKFKKSQNGNYMVEVKFEVDEEDAVDIDGGSDVGSIFDNMVFTAKAAKLLKLKLRGLSYDGAETLVINDVDDIKELVEDLKENYVGQPVELTVYNEEYDGKVRTKVQWINQPKDN
jgi:hypothetical protein